MKYTQQRTNYDCGPVAIINALKWAGENISYSKSKNFFKRICDSEGTDLDAFHLLVKHPNSAFRCVKGYKALNLGHIRKHLKLGQACIIVFRSNAYDLHTALITGITKDRIEIVNFAYKETVSNIRIKQFMPYLRTSYGYFIKKLA